MAVAVAEGETNPGGLGWDGDPGAGGLCPARRCLQLAFPGEGSGEAGGDPYGPLAVGAASSSSQRALASRHLPRAVPGYGGRVPGGEG